MDTHALASLNSQDRYKHLNYARGPHARLARAHGYDADDEELSGRIFRAGKKADHTLTQGELEALIGKG